MSEVPLYTHNIVPLCNSLTPHRRARVPGYLLTAP